MSSAPSTRILPSPSLGAIETLLGHVSCGELQLQRPDGSRTAFVGTAPGPSADVLVKNARAARRILTAGAIGLAEGYMRGEWDSPDVKAVLDLSMRNVERASIPHLPTPLRPVQRLWHKLRDNSTAQARRNIAHHYDLGNDFYRLWLDETMTYSSAMFETEGDDGAEPLPSAQRRKWDRLLDRLQPSRRDHILEIGCGWGGFALHAAREAGCRITGITLSQEQRDWATRRVAEEGLEGRVEVRLQDYRNVPETYTSIASIEMFEAVGERWWPVFFQRLTELLAQGGRAALQTITIRDETFDHYRSNPDFIQRYIFPGGMLPSPERFERAAATGGLRASEPHFFGMSYARTIERWAERLEAAAPRVRDLGFDERFIRMWRYYLAYCRTGFESGNVDVMQVTLDRQ